MPEVHPAMGRIFSKTLQASCQPTWCPPFILERPDWYIYNLEQTHGTQCANMLFVLESQIKIYQGISGQKHIFHEFDKVVQLIEYCNFASGAWTICIYNTEQVHEAHNFPESQHNCVTPF
jgi:hypothetical protein